MTTKIEIGKFEKIDDSRYLRINGLEFEQNGQTHTTEIGSGHSAVAILLFHKQFNNFLVVEQFRPAPYVNRISSRIENKGKDKNMIEWTKYPRDEGFTRELCAGLVDKPLPLKEVAREEIEEECGYTVPSNDIHHVVTYLYNLSTGGSTLSLFYAEINEDQKISEGGGNIHEGEFINKIWLTVDDARQLISAHSSSPPSFIFAFQWWFYRRNVEKVELGNDWSADVFPVNTNKMSNIRFIDSPVKRFDLFRMHYTINGLKRAWDMSLVGNCSAILAYHRPSDRLILTQRFRPGVFIAKVRALPENKANPLTTIQWDQYDERLAYTLELCSTHIRDGEEDSDAARRGVFEKLGWRVGRTELIQRMLVGISESGEDMAIFFVEVIEEIAGHHPPEGVTPIYLSREKARSLLSTPIVPCPPALLFTLQWFMQNVPSTNVSL